MFNDTRITIRLPKKPTNEKGLALNIGSQVNRAVHSLSVFQNCHTNDEFHFISFSHFPHKYCVYLVNQKHGYFKYKIKRLDLIEAVQHL